MNMDLLMQGLNMMQQALSDGEPATEPEEQVMQGEPNPGDQMKPEDQPQKQAPQISSPAETELEDKPPENDEAEADVGKSIKALENKLMKEIKKSEANNKNTEALGKIVAMMGVMAKNQEETDQMMGNFLEGLGLADQVKKSWDESQKKPAQKEMTMQEAIVAMGQEIAKGMGGQKVIQMPTQKSEDSEMSFGGKVFKNKETVLGFSQALRSIQ